jgi:endonuclease YncB( thermonuclease family)
MLRAFLLATALALVTVPAAALSLTGPARVIDGDTLDLRGMRIRLAGIDAPELDQSCRREGRVWPCGRWAGARLTAQIAGRDVTCLVTGKDRYGRRIATCRAGHRDLGRSLVQAGAALAYRRYSMAYVGDEIEAAGAGRGVWADWMLRPEDHRRSTAGTADPG